MMNHRLPGRRGSQQSHTLTAMAHAMIIVGTLTTATASARSDGKPLTLTEVASPLSSMNVADLGVVDADGDGILDLFATTHTFRTVLLLGNGRGGFVDASDRWGLAVHPAIPGLEGSLDVPESSGHGLHIFFDGGRLILRSNNSDARYHGQLRFTQPVTALAEGGFASGSTGAGAKARLVEFTTDGVGTLTIPPWFPKDRIVVTLAEGTSLDQVVIGRNAVPVPAREVTLSLVDRHGAAWADFDGDDDLDVFISAGGMVGNAPAHLRDELFTMQHGTLENQIARSGIVKKRARGRRVEWVDYDGDGRLDLYVGNQKSANQLWRQKADGGFENVAPDLGLDLRPGGLFRWLDADGDNDSDLLVPIARAPSLLFINTNGTFAAIKLADSSVGKPKNMAVADYDSDGDLDVFVADADTNRVFLGENGSFRVVKATTVGFPVRSVAASWVDADNDGRMDLHLVPGKLRLQQSGGGFLNGGVEVGLQPAIAHCAWLDFDSDGDRDCICASAPSERNRPPGQHELFSNHVAFRNEAKGNHWIAIDLVGPPRNRQAIGATMISSVAGKQRRHMVGESEGAHWSQGHYRIYVGLGSNERPDWLDVTWPDGSHTRLESPEADRRIEIRWQPAAR